MSEWQLLCLQLACTLFMVGLIWFVQIVNYPLMEQVGVEPFTEYSRRHQARTSRVVLGPMLVEAASAVYLFVRYEDLRASWRYQTAMIGLAVIWISTLAILVPLHRRLAVEYNMRTIRSLVRTNWLRTAAWTLRAVLLGQFIWTREFY